MSLASVPFVDEHTRAVAAPAGEVWRAVADLMCAPASAAADLYGRLVGVHGGRAFEVARSEPPHRLVLVGEHRFARYSLVFLIDELGPGRSALRAQTWAAFPGAAGRLYRGLVIDSRAHVLVVRRMLARIARRAERAGAGGMATPA